MRRSSFRQSAQLDRHVAALVRGRALLAVKQPHRGVFVVPERLGEKTGRHPHLPCRACDLPIVKNVDTPCRTQRFSVVDEAWRPRGSLSLAYPVVTHSH